MNLGKLSTKKDKVEGFGKEAGLNFMSLADDGTYLQDPPKSARLRESAFPSFVMRHAAKGGAQREPDQLYSIKEEHQTLESSQVTLVSGGKGHHSESGARPKTPDFSHLQSMQAEEGDSEDGDALEHQQIRERMEAQIRGFDED